MVKGQGKPVLCQGLVIPDKDLAQGDAGQQGQLEGLLLVMRQRVGAGPAPGKIIGKWVGHELEATWFKPFTS